MTNDQIVALAESLRAVGVSRFMLGDLTVEFAPVVFEAPDERRTDVPPPIDAVTAAAQRLSARRVA